MLGKIYDGKCLIRGLLLILSCSGVTMIAQVKSEEVTEQRDVSDFSSIDASGGYNLTITAGKPYSLSIKGLKEDIDKIETLVRGNELIIRQKQDIERVVIVEGLIKDVAGSGNIICNRSGCTVERRLKEIAIEVTLPSLERLTRSGFGDTWAKGVKGDRFVLEKSGSGDIEIDSLSVAEVELKISGSGDANVVVPTAKNIQLTISGSGDLVLRGKTDFLKISKSGSGDVRSEALESASALVKASGSGRVRLKVTKNLDLNCSGSGNVYYSGNPIVNKSVRGSCKVIQQA